MQIMHVFTKNLANGHNARTSTTLHIFCCDHFYETYKRKEKGTLDKTDKGERTVMHPNIHAARRRLNLDGAGRINTTKNSSDEN